MPRKATPLTDSAIKVAKPKDSPYKLTDGQGLYLEVTPNGSKLWRLKYRFDGKEKRLAERVYRALVGEGFTEALPGTAERIKEWIKPVAPDYARKGGRRRKTP